MIILVIISLLVYSDEETVWASKKRFFSVSIKISFVFLLSSLLCNNDNKTFSLKVAQKKENMILSNDAILETRSQGKSRINYIVLKFQNTDTIFRLDSAHYDYAFTNAIFRELQKGDTIAIYHYATFIWSLEKNGKEYCNLEKLNKVIIRDNLHRKENNSWRFTFSILMIVLNFILLFYDEEPRFNYKAIYWVLILTLWIYLAFAVGCESDKAFFRNFYQYTPPQ